MGNQAFACLSTIFHNPTRQMVWKSFWVGTKWLTVRPQRYFFNRMNLQEVKAARSGEWKPVLKSKGLCREHFKLKQQDPEKENLYWGLSAYAVSTSSSRDQNYVCGWKPVSWSSPWIAAGFFGKKCFWIKTSDPSLSLTLMLKIQLWLNPPELDAWQSSSKKTKPLIGWIPALGGFFSRSLKLVRSVLGVVAKAICGLKP